MWRADVNRAGEVYFGNSLGTSKGEGDGEMLDSALPYASCIWDVAPVSYF